jgi:hypothetical protein
MAIIKSITALDRFTLSTTRADMISVDCFRLQSLQVFKSSSQRLRTVYALFSSYSSVQLFILTWYIAQSVAGIAAPFSLQRRGAATISHGPRLIQKFYHIGSQQVGILRCCKVTA